MILIVKGTFSVFSKPSGHLIYCKSPVATEKCVRHLHKIYEAINNKVRDESQHVPAYSKFFNKYYYDCTLLIDMYPIKH
jgi:hypothetical protein